MISRKRTAEVRMKLFSLDFWCHKARAVTAGLLASACLSLSGMVAAADQQSFPTPQAAVEAFAAALQSPGYDDLLALFGRKHREIIQPSDAAIAEVNKERMAKSIKEYWVLRDAGPDREQLLLGFDAWPLPVPLVRESGQWRFATELGADEILNRRIGADELNAIHVLRAYVDAQREYAAKDRMGDDVLQYAQKLGSTPGKQDGLYWAADPQKGEEASPFGPLVAEAGAYLKGHQAGDGYKGYRFKVLTRQAASAPGGAYSYVINGRMIAGFALLAYPAEYGETGIMSFIVSHSGKVYQKDLGPKTETIAGGMKAYDPGPGWKLVSD
jgi:DUF2950 family protein